MVTLENARIADIVSTVQKELKNDVNIEQQRELIIQDIVETNSVISVVSAGVPTNSITTLVFVDTFASTENIVIISPKIENITTSFTLNIILEVEKDYSTGFIDFYQEPISLTTNVLLRDGNELLLDSPSIIILKDSTEFTINNRPISLDSISISYSIGNIGNNISKFNSWAFANTGLLPNSGTSIQEIQLAYPSLKIEDLNNALSSFIKSGLYWNYAHPAITNPVTNITENITLLNNESLFVSSTSNYPSSGKLLIIKNSEVLPYTIITYTGISSNSFTGCSIVSGDNTFVVGDEVRADLI